MDRSGLGGGGQALEMPHPPHLHPVGEHFGPFQVIRYLAAGGMADLYLVREPGRKEPLVLKRVQARYLDNPKVISLFLDEGQIGALLNHPSLVRVYSNGEVQGLRYIAMEYIPGHDLVEVLRACTTRRVSVPRDLAVALCEKVARGLSHAHELRGPDGRPLEIVHCDISPGNVMISFRGAIKLVDFGVARAQIPLHCPERGVAGKYNYMAPEQILGAPIDRRADLFSLGVILHELTCGQRLFKGRPEVVMRQIVEEPIPSPLDLCPDYPESLAAVVMRLLDRDPTRRYPTAEALRVDLTAFLAQVAEAHGTRHGKRHGKKEMAHFLRSLFAPKDAYEAAAAAADVTEVGEVSGQRTHPLIKEENETRETMDFSDRSLPPKDAGVPRAGHPSAMADDRPRPRPRPREDPEEALLTRCDNPYLDASQEHLTPLPRDPDRTHFIAVPGQGSGGLTTHMLGDGSTYPRRLMLPAEHGDDGAHRSETAVALPRSPSARVTIARLRGLFRAVKAGLKGPDVRKTPGRTRLRILVFSSLALLGLVLAYYIAQR